MILIYSKSDEYVWARPHKPYFFPDGTLHREIAKRREAAHSRSHEVRVRDHGLMMGRIEPFSRSGPS